MATPMTLRVLTEAGLALDDLAVSIRAPGEIGYLGVLSHHAPLVTTLQPGTLSWRTPGGQTHQRRIGTGLFEVSHNLVTILTSTVSEVAGDAHVG